MATIQDLEKQFKVAAGSDTSKVKKKSTVADLESTLATHKSSSPAIQPEVEANVPPTGGRLPSEGIQTGARILTTTLRLAKDMLVEPIVAVGKLPLNLPKVQDGSATEAQDAESRLGIATVASVPASIVGGLLGAAAGAPGGPPGMIIGGGIGSGLLGTATFAALESKETGKKIGGIFAVPESADDVVQQAKNVGTAGLIGAGLGGLLGIFAVAGKGVVQAISGKVRTRSGGAVPGAEAPPAKATEVPAALKTATKAELDDAAAMNIQNPKKEVPLQRVIKDRQEAHGSSASPADVFEGSPNAGGSGTAMREAARREYTQIDNVEQLKGEGSRVVWDNIASVKKAEFFSGQRARDLRKQFSKQEREDMTFFREGTENPFIQGDTPAALVKRLSPEAKKQVKVLGEVLDETRNLVNESGYGNDVGYLENYISHLWTPGDRVAKNLARRWVTKNPFSNKRSYATFVEGMQKAGLKPRTVDMGELVQFYENTSARVMANNRLVSELGSLKLPDGTAAMMASSKAPGDFVRINNPLFGNGRMAVAPEIAPSVQFLTDQPFQGQFIRGVQTFNAFAKKSELSFSMFHHFSLTESSAILTTIKPKFLIPFKSSQEALFGKGKDLLRDPKFVGEYLDAGGTFSIPGDVQAGIVRKALLDLEQRTRGVPGINKITQAIRSGNDIWDNVLWEKYHNGLKALTYHEVKQHLLQKFPEVPETQIRRKVAEAMNNIYGGQNWDKMFLKFHLSPKGQQISQAVLLAPDWTVSNINVGLQPFSKDQITRNIGARVFLGHAYFLTLMSQMMNLAFTGMKGEPHFSWDNDTGHKFDVEMPWRGAPRPGQKEGPKQYLKLGKQVRELFTLVSDPTEFLGRKFGPLSRVITEQMFEASPTGFPSTFSDRGFQMRGERPTFLREAELRAKQVGEQFIPFSMQPQSPVKFAENGEVSYQSPIVLSGSQAFFTFPMAASTTPFKTIKNLEAAIHDTMDANDDPDKRRRAEARIALLIQTADENNINGQSMYKVAMGNVKRLERTRERKQNEQ